MRICLINQPAGLGDIFYTQRIGQHFRSLGYEIVWPVIKAYDWLSNYMTSEGLSDEAFFTSKNKSFVQSVINLCNSGRKKGNLTPEKEIRGQITARCDSF